MGTSTKLEFVLKEEESESDKNSEIIEGKINSSSETTLKPNYEELDSKIDSLLGKSDNGVWMCKKCNYTSKFKTHVRIHIEHHISGFEQSCNICAKTFKTRLTFRMHKPRCEKKIDESRYVFQSNVGQASEESSESAEELDLKIKALLEKSDSGIWHCKECNYKSKFKGQVKRHVEIHIPGYIYPCHLCSKFFKTRVSLKMHIA